MSIKRVHSEMNNKWTVEEEALLKQIYPVECMEKILQAISRHTRLSIEYKAWELGLSKEKSVRSRNISLAHIGKKPSNETTAKMRKCVLNESVFDIITEESAYWIGFLMADGNVSYHGAMRRIALHLKEIDVNHVKKFRIFVGSSHKLGTYTNKKKNNTSYSLSFCSEKMADKLAEYGIIPQKCFTAKIITLEDNRNTWRGIIDGDGTMGIYCRKIATGIIRPIPYISLTSSLEICQ